MSNEETVVTEAAAPAKKAAKKATKKAVKKVAKKAPVKKAKKEAGGARGRKSEFAGKTIHKLVDKNPRREGTAGFDSFKAIRNGMTYEQYIAAGGRSNDLKWDIAHKYVKVSK